MLRRMGAALCGVAIIVVCSVPTHAAVKPGHLVRSTRRYSEKTGLGSFIGAASTYNPLRPGYASGGKRTASGESYEENTWAAAIQMKLRGFFGGVFSGKAYHPTFALVEAGDKRAVVKINDVGPLKPDALSILMSTL